MFDFVFKFNNGTVESCDFDIFLVESIVEFSFSFSILFFNVMDISVEILDFIVEFFSFGVPFVCFSFLSFEPFVVFFFGFSELFFKFIGCSFVETHHLLNF